MWRVITGELKSVIDAVWNDFWAGGISNSLEVMEQLTLLLFIKGLDEAHTNAERKANRTEPEAFLEAAPGRRHRRQGAQRRSAQRRRPRGAASSARGRRDRRRRQLRRGQ
jgi:hypothetical protein